MAEEGRNAGPFDSLRSLRMTDFFILWTLGKETLWIDVN